MQNLKNYPQDYIIRTQLKLIIRQAHLSASKREPVMIASKYRKTHTPNQLDVLQKP